MFAVPSRSRLASISTSVAVNPISSVAPISMTVALAPWINCDASLKQSLFVLLRVNPVPSVCVRVVSESAPKERTAESDNNLRSSPITASFATLNPPSVCREPSVVEVASVVSSVIILPKNVEFLLLSILRASGAVLFPLLT